MSIKIIGLDSLKKKLNDPRGLIAETINKSGGIETGCPNCQKVIKVPTTGTTCSCGQEVVVDFKD